MNKVDAYYSNKQEPNKSCLLALRQIIVDQNALVTETLKWGIPCFSYKKKMFCFLTIEKATALPYILFVSGKRLDFEALELRDRKQMKSLHINPTQDIPLRLIIEIVNAAIEICK
ncbi:DUF1801 domain-containing protein [Aquimarina agarivorans]|uniref:DUF1801 domain-containing protein n=1 Tax=Aquimarina agarivorans TaxID=980584 RepID=UPI000248EA46|nr:DUF1801 domain-containing protein [Aquimarina agarivorans]